MPFPIFALIFLVGSVGAYLTKAVAGSPEFSTFLGTYRPWLASHAADLGYASTAIVLTATMAVPWVLAHGEHDEELEAAQNTLADLLKPLLIIALIVSVGYLLGIGFFAAKQAFGI
ncbi:hypothetical protein [Pandoraea commovens]|uniref:Uncharacterized protein n=1 Tax=Pandoraea commovens TaxID=2508289 RepID=A0ABY5QAE9_9BURK|nr:hypothetical protein [Pandoraea commovens]UVA77128.1 hypothetical protein NTU39_00290 [Pandoraea commovens]